MALAPKHRFYFTEGWVKVVLVMVLSALVVMVTMPAYGSGHLPWATSPQTPPLERLKTLQTQGITLPGWRATRHQEVVLNQQNWILAEYSRPAEFQVSASGVPEVATLALLMCPQHQPDTPPGVEWLSISSAQHLSTSSRILITFRVHTGGRSIATTARLIRSHNQKQTFAALQWYAWPTGGHPSPTAWFWQDQWSQLIHRSRIPWVAVTALIPMAPLADLEAYQAVAMEVGSAIQQQLIETISHPPKA